MVQTMNRERVTMTSKAIARGKAVAETFEAETFTVAQARSEGGIPDYDAAVAIVRAQKSTADRVAGTVMWNASLLAYNVLEVTKSHTQQDYVDAVGFSKAYGTLLKRLGRAAVVHGVKRGSAEWAFLCVHGGKAPVGKAIAEDDSEAFRKALSGMMAEVREHGKITQGARTPGGETAQTESETDRSNGSETAESRTATLEDVVKALSEMVKTVDRETWAAVESRLHDIITRENTIRAKQ